MRSIELGLQGGWKVLYTALLFGAGVPIVYALAMRALTAGASTITDADGRTRIQLRPTSKLLAALLLLVIVGAVVLGITIIAASGLGKVVVFDGGLPSLHDK